MVDLQHRLVAEVLGIARLRAIVGISMGCMNAWQWAEAYPDAMDEIDARRLLSISDHGAEPPLAQDGGERHQIRSSLGRR